MPAKMQFFGGSFFILNRTEGSPLSNPYQEYQTNTSKHKRHNTIILSQQNGYFLSHVVITKFSTFNISGTAKVICSS